jgi:hypothetical protein
MKLVIEDWLIDSACRVLDTLALLSRTGRMPANSISPRSPVNENCEVQAATTGRERYLPFNIINLTEAAWDDDSELVLSELAKHNGLDETVTALENALRRIDEAAEPPVAQKVFSELTPVLKSLIDIDGRKSSNWNDLLLKPNNENTLCSGAMVFEHNELLLKLVFPNRMVAMFARAALLCWTSGIAHLQHSNQQLRSMVSQYRELAKSRKQPKADRNGWNMHTNKKPKADRKAEHELWQKIESLVEEDESICINSTNVTESITTKRVWLDDLQERFIALELRRFDPETFDIWNLAECSAFQDILKSADIFPSKMHEIKYPKFLDPREAKVFIILPESQLNVLITAIINQSDETAICEVRASVILPETNEMVSVNLLEGYKCALDYNQPAKHSSQAIEESQSPAADQAQAITQSRPLVTDQDDNAMSDEHSSSQQQQPQQQQLKPVILSYASILKHATLQQHNLLAPVKHTKAVAQQQNEKHVRNRAANKPSSVNKSDVASLETKITEMIAMMNNLKQENEQLRQQLNDQRNASKQSVSNNQANVINIDSITKAIKAEMKQQANSINDKFDVLNAQLRADVDESTKNIASLVNRMVKQALKRETERANGTPSRKRKCRETSQISVSQDSNCHRMNDEINNLTSSDESGSDSLAN